MTLCFIYILLELVAAVPGKPGSDILTLLVLASGALASDWT